MCPAQHWSFTLDRQVLLNSSEWAFLRRIGTLAASFSIMGYTGLRMCIHPHRDSPAGAQEVNRAVWDFLQEQWTSWLSYEHDNWASVACGWGSLDFDDSLLTIGSENYDENPLNEVTIWFNENGQPARRLAEHWVRVILAISRTSLLTMLFELGYTVKENDTQLPRLDRDFLLNTRYLFFLWEDKIAEAGKTVVELNSQIDGLNTIRYNQLPLQAQQLNDKVLSTKQCQCPLCATFKNNTDLETVFSAEKPWKLSLQSAWYYRDNPSNQTILYTHSGGRVICFSGPYADPLILYQAPKERTKWVTISLSFNQGPPLQSIAISKKHWLTILMNDRLKKQTKLLQLDLRSPMGSWVEIQPKGYNPARIVGSFRCLQHNNRMYFLAKNKKGQLALLYSRSAGKKAKKLNSGLVVNGKPVTGCKSLCVSPANSSWLFAIFTFQDDYIELCRSKDHGQSWEAVVLSDSFIPEYVCPSSNPYRSVVGCFGYMQLTDPDDFQTWAACWFSEDLGDNWSLSMSLEKNETRTDSACCTAKGDWYWSVLANQQATIFHSKDDGKTWEKCSQTRARNLYSDPRRPMGVDILSEGSLMRLWLDSVG